MNEFFEKWAVIFIERLMKDFNIGVLDAVAIVGNGGAESGGFKSLQELKPLVKGSRGGYGIMQWTGPRRRAYEAYCKRNNLNPADMESNYKFLFVELNGAEGKDGKVLQRVKAAPSLNAKVEVFMNEFLRPGIPHLESRIRWAHHALAAWNAQAIRDIPKPVPKPKPEPAIPPKRTWWQIIKDWFK